MLAGGGASREAASATPGRRLSRPEPRQGRQTGSRGGGRAKPDRTPGCLRYLPSWGTEHWEMLAQSTGCALTGAMAAIAVVC